MWISKQEYANVREAIRRLEEANKQGIKALEEVDKRAFLIGIERNNRMLEFTFVRNKEFTVIKTMSVMSDNLPEWKERLLL